ncbi:AzlC family ABC transporter permease [Streptomyces aurantiacus]|uniref:Branched-chain amino acid ABC transporter permease n=2 Tax=Streptomyces aurantiacus group TaxID=2838335 RepID=A0A7G1P0A0_9ACTN|nr:MULTISPECIES: AzlC family ABC transporter permease [Streptomyces aurantiacus group]MDQ0774008.1 4-azaleucine resistance transporter AzlC [Streptomyces aurantiacus]BCL27206.1 branched-chain amino acid ABC transporter permease [Streptomyces aurantiacus]
MTQNEQAVDREMWSALGALSAAAAVIGVSFGAIAVASGVPGWLAIAMSVFIHAGGAQFLSAGLLAVGNPVAAVVGGLLLNARHLPFGLALRDTLGDTWWARVAGSQLISDESVAFALSRPEGPARRRAFWACGIALTFAWDGGTVVGVLLAGSVGDPNALGMDTAFPAGLLALVLPSLRDRTTRDAALLGSALALLTTPLLPAGIPLMLSLAALALPALTSLRRDDPVSNTGEEGLR